jgi:YVTN family beta-propeller protein
MLSVVVAMTLTACGMGSVAGPGAGTAAPGGVVIATVRLPDYGTDVAAGAAGKAYAVAAGKVIAVDTAAGQVTATVALDGQPYALALTPDGRRAYVADFLGQYVSVVDTAGATVAARIPIGTIQRPSLRPSVAVSRDGARVYVGNTAADHLLAVATDGNRIAKDLFLDIHPAAVAVSPDGATVYVAGCTLVCTTGTLLAIDTTSWATTARIALATAPNGLVVTPDGRRAYTVNGTDASVSMIDLTTRTVQTFSVDPEPAGIAIGPRGSLVFVTSAANGTLSAISTTTNTVVARAPVGNNPRAVAVSADGTRAYLTHASSTLSIVDVGRLRR